MRPRPDQYAPTLEFLARIWRFQTLKRRILIEKLNLSAPCCPIHPLDPTYWLVSGPTTLSRTVILTNFPRISRRFFIHSRLRWSSGMSSPSLARRGQAADKWHFLLGSCRPRYVTWSIKNSVSPPSNSVLNQKPRFVMSCLCCLLRAIWRSTTLPSALLLSRPCRR